MRTFPLFIESFSWIMNPEYFKTIFLISQMPESWPGEFAIITGNNPMDVQLSDQENDLRNQKLYDKTRNKIFLNIIGSSPDRSHQEPSFALTCSIKEAIQMGKEFEQRAVFYVRKGMLKLIECSSEKCEEMGNFEDRLLLS